MVFLMIALVLAGSSQVSPAIRESPQLKDKVTGPPKPNPIDKNSSPAPIAGNRRCPEIAVPEGVSINASCSPFISNIHKLLESCPTTDPAIATILSDFEIRRNGNLVRLIPCTPPISKLPLSKYTDELILLQTLRVMYYMRRTPPGSLPWTRGTLYDWLKSKVRGFNINDLESNAASCCTEIGGKMSVSVAPLKNDNFNRDLKRRWIGISGNLGLYAHERRHLDGFGHVSCKKSDNMDQEYDEKNLSPFGVQWWLYKNWLSEILGVGFACLSDSERQETADFFASTCEGYRTGRFCGAAPPVTAAPASWRQCSDQALISAQDEPRRDGRRLSPPASGARPDLTVERGIATGEFTVKAYVSNIGQADSVAFAIHLDVYDADNKRIKEFFKISKPLSKGLGGEFLFVTSPLSMTGKRFQIVVDPRNFVDESNETNNRTPLKSTNEAVAGGRDETDAPPAKTNPSVDLAAINVFPATDGKKNVIHGVIRNLGSEPYSGSRGKRQTTITLTLVKDGKESQQKLGTAGVPDISAGGQQIIAFPSPPEFASVDGYRLTLTISGGDSNTKNDSKINTSAGFSSEVGSPDADLEAAEVARILESGVARIKGVVRNVSSQRFKGEREVRLYFVDQTGSEGKSTLIASETVKNIAAGERWEIIGDLPAALKQAKHFLLKLNISAGDNNPGNDKKTRAFGNL
jgi:hypothetical protein